MIDHNALFPKVMEDNDLWAVEYENRFVIHIEEMEDKRIKSSWRHIIGGAVIGLILILGLDSKLIGAYFIIGLSIYGIGLWQKEKSRKKSVEIGEKYVIIKRGRQTQRVDIEASVGFYTDIIQHDEFHYIGKIMLVTDEGKYYEFLEITNSNESELQNELLVVTNFVKEHYLPNISL